MKKTLPILFLSSLLSAFSFGQSSPTTAAPTPTVSSAKVTSIFSDAYTDVAGTDFNPSWGQATVATQVSIAGNNTLKYDGLNYQGISLGSNQNVSSKSFLHLDFWSDNSTSLSVYLISPGPVETPYTLTAPTTGWASVDIPLSSFSPVDLSNVFQLKFVGNGTVFIDNLYFYEITTTPTNDASLKDLLVDGTSIAGFSASKFDYKVTLPRGTTAVPVVTAISNAVGAGVVVTPASGIPGTSSVVVTATDGTTKKTYSVAFTEILSLPINYEAPGSYSFIDFDGGVATVIPNPYSSGINTSATVAKIVRNGGQTWAGSKMYLTNKLDFSSVATLSMKVYSPRVGVTVLFKLEGDGGVNTELSVKTTVANQWETLKWDFTGKPSNTYYALVFMFDFGTVGDGSANSTFLFDDVVLSDNNVGLPQRNAVTNNMVLYPIPAENNLYFSAKSRVSKAEVYNVVGKKVKQYNSVNESVDVSDLKSGVYVIRVTDENGKTFSTKFLKK